MVDCPDNSTYVEGGIGDVTRNCKCNDGYTVAISIGDSACIR